MIETQGAAIAAYERRTENPVRIAGGTSAEAKSRAWPGASIALHADLAAVAPLWRAFEAHAACTVFQNFDYLAVWFRNVGTRARVTPAIVVLKDREGILAILPLAVERGRLFRRLTWLGQDVCDYLNPLMSEDFARLPPERFAALWCEIRALMQSHPRFRHDWIDLRRMPATVGALENPMLALPTIRHASDAYAATLGDSWNEFYRSRRTGRARKQDRSKLARLEEFGDVALVSPRDADETAHMIDALFAQKAETLDRKGVGEIFSAPGCRAFFHDLATNPRTRDLVHVSALAVGPSLAAINLGMEYLGRYSLFLVSYDRSFARLSPGVIHLNRLIERAIGRGLTEFDFLVGESRVKREWTDRRIPLHDHVAAANWRGHLMAIPVRAAAGLKRTIKQTPALWMTFQRVRAGLGAIKRAVRP